MELIKGLIFEFSVFDNDMSTFHLILEVTESITCKFEKLMLYVLLVCLIRDFLAMQSLIWSILSF